jgi:chemotaxis response regulator CheB
MSPTFRSESCVMPSLNLVFESVAKVMSVDLVVIVKFGALMDFTLP